MYIKKEIPHKPLTYKGLILLSRTRSGNTKYKTLWNSINLNTTDIQHITNIKYCTKYHKIALN